MCVLWGLEHTSGSLGHVFNQSIEPVSDVRLMLWLADPKGKARTSESAKDLDPEKLQKLQ